MFVTCESLQQRGKPSLYNQLIPWKYQGICFQNMNNSLVLLSWDEKQQRTCNISFSSLLVSSSVIPDVNSLGISEDGTVLTSIVDHTLNVYIKTNAGNQVTSKNPLYEYQRIPYALQGDVCVSRVFHYRDDSTLVNMNSHW